MDPLFSALSKAPQEARMHAPNTTKTGLLSSIIRGVSSLVGGGQQVAKQVLPSLELKKSEVTKLQKAAMAQISQMKDIQLSKFNVGECILDRIAFSSSNEKPMSERKIIVYFLPNYVLWQENIEFFNELRNNLGVDIVCSNYRGCGRSTGFPETEQPLINDGLAQVQQLIDQGAKPENIALFGYSLGGGVSMSVAGTLEDHKISVNVINERSFRSLSAIIKSFVDGAIAKELGATGAQSLGWSLPSEDMLKKLKGRVVLIHNDKDDVIDFDASLKGAYDSKKYPNKAKITCVAMQQTKTKGQHNRAWTVADKKAIYDAIRRSIG